jgi:hypothetical protein
MNIVAKGTGFVTGVIMIVIGAGVLATQNAASLGTLTFLILGFCPPLLGLSIILNTLKGGK